MTETSIKNAIMKKLSLYKGSFFFRVAGGQYQKSGISDILGTYNGQTVAIEVKTPAAYKRKNNGCTKNQLEFLQQISVAGGASFVVCSAQQVMDCLEEVQKLQEQSKIESLEVGQQ